MQVRLLNSLNNAEKIMFVACRTCYSNKTVDELLNDDVKTDLLFKVLRSGHHSILEHIQATFSIEGVSRSLLAQISRHRHISLSVRSQRYCKFDFDYILPESIKSNKAVDDLLWKITDTYCQLVDGGIKKEDARAILPNASVTNMILSCNLRELVHICNLRLCLRSQAEIRSMVGLMRDCVVKELPLMKEFLVPKCKTCTESEKCNA